MTAAKSNNATACALDAGVEHIGLGERRTERFRGSIELALLDLGTLELHENPLVLDGPRHVPRGKDERLLVDGRKRTIIDAIDQKNAARLPMLHDRYAANRADRARSAVIGELEARLETVEHDVRPPHQHRADHAVAREKGAFGHVIGRRRELADASVGSGFVLPDEEGRVQTERLPQQIEGKEHGLMDLFDARARQPLVLAGPCRNA